MREFVGLGPPMVMRPRGWGLSVLRKSLLGEVDVRVYEWFRVLTEACGGIFPDNYSDFSISQSQANPKVPSVRRWGDARCTKLNARF